MTDTVTKVEVMADDVAAIRRLLEGDKYTPGLVARVSSNTADIATMKKRQENSGYSNSTLVAVSWMFLVSAVVITVLDRGALISDIRHLTNMTGAQAWVLSVFLGFGGKFLVAFPTAVFVYGILNRDK